MYSVFQQDAVNAIQRIAATVKITISIHNSDFTIIRRIFNIVSFTSYRLYVKVDYSA